MRGGPGRLPDRPRRRRLRLPLRHRPPIPGRQRARRRAASPPCGGSRRCSPRSASRRARAPARRAARSTPAGVVAWPPSSSPGCPSTGRTLNACTGTARLRWPRRAHDPSRARSLQGRPGRDAHSGAHARPLPLAGPRLSAWSSPAPPGPRWRRPGHARSWPCRWARSSSTGPICPSTPTPASPLPWPRDWRDRCAGRLRGARPSPTAPAASTPISPGRSWSGTPSWPTSWSSWCARPAAPSPAWCSSTRTAATTRRWPRSRARAGGGRRRARLARLRRPPAATRTPAGPRRRLLLAIDPSAVRLELAEPGGTEPLEELLPRLRAEGVRPVSSNGVLGDPTGASAEEGRELLDALVSDLARPPSSHWSPLVSPAAVVTGRGAGHRRGDGRHARGRRAGRWWRWTAPRTTRRWTTPWRRRPISRSWPVAMATRYATWWATCAAASDMRAAVDEAVGHFGGLQAAVAAAGVISGGPAVGDRATPSGTRSSTSTSTASATWPPPPCQCSWSARTAPGTGGRGGLGRRAAGSAPAGRVQRVEACGHRPDPVARRRPGRDRHHGQRGVPGLDPRTDARRVGRRLRASSAEEFARQQLVERLLEPTEPAALIAWLCGADVERRDRGRPPGRRRPDDLVGPNRRCRWLSAPTWTRSPTSSRRRPTAAASACGSAAPGCTCASVFVRRGQLLRLLAQPARHEALPRGGPPADPVLPARRGLGLVLRRRVHHGARLGLVRDTVLPRPRTPLQTGYVTLGNIKSGLQGHDLGSQCRQELVDLVDVVPSARAEGICSLVEVRNANQMNQIDVRSPREPGTPQSGRYACPGARCQRGSKDCDVDADSEGPQGGKSEFLETA